jgi:hypothetical protein
MVIEMAQQIFIKLASIKMDQNQFICSQVVLYVKTYGAILKGCP